MSLDVLGLLGDLREITATPGRGCTRVAYTALEDQAHDLVWTRFAGRGFRRVTDGAGNMFVLPEWLAAAAEPPEVVLVGSHLDTVIEGGWLDGALGVAAAAHVLDELAGKRRRIALVVFRDEEGVRFGAGLFGSRVFAGLCGEADLDLADGEGVRLRDVVPDPAACLGYEPPVRPTAYLECHIEQGLRLIERGRRVAVVTGMVGIRRLELRGAGAANHAGTTEMHRRVDALLPVAAVVARLPELVDDIPDAVITCGRIGARPGAANIIPGDASALVEIRAADGATIDRIEQRFRQLVGTIQPPTPRTRRAELTLTPVADIAPAPMDERLATLLAQVCSRRGLPFERLSSMAGHDAQHVAHVCPAGMLFIPSLGGISHSPDESSTEEDILLAAELMTAWAGDAGPA